MLKFLFTSSCVLHTEWLPHYQCVFFAQGEGVAYRGRILVEMSTKLEGKMDKSVDSIHSDDILVAQVILTVSLSDIWQVWFKWLLVWIYGDRLRQETLQGNL